MGQILTNDSPSIPLKFVGLKGVPKAELGTATFASHYGRK